MTRAEAYRRWRNAPHGQKHRRWREYVLVTARDLAEDPRIREPELPLEAA